MCVIEHELRPVHGNHMLALLVSSLYCRYMQAAFHLLSFAVILKSLSPSLPLSWPMGGKCCELQLYHWFSQNKVNPYSIICTHYWWASFNPPLPSFPPSLSGYFLSLSLPCPVRKLITNRIMFTYSIATTIQNEQMSTWQCHYYTLSVHDIWHMHHTCTCTCRQGCTCTVHALVSVKYSLQTTPHSLYLTLCVNLHTCGCHEAIQVTALAYKQTPWRVEKFIYKLQETAHRGRR